MNIFYAWKIFEFKRTEIIIKDVLFEFKKGAFATVKMRDSTFCRNLLVLIYFVTSYL